MKRLLAPLAAIAALAVVARVVIGVDAARALGLFAPLPPLLTFAILAAVPLVAMLVAIPLLGRRPGAQRGPAALGVVLRSVFLLLVGLVAVLGACLVPGRYDGEQSRAAVAATLVDAGLDARWGPVLLNLLAAAPAVPLVVLLVFVALAARRPPERPRRSLHARTVLLVSALVWVVTAAAVWLAHPTPTSLA
ncbi:hypothetical protein [Nocardioides sp.]|uniref:hypothetical protein n=1 Tax=Nocardioides sp. TaxID=35761 RepID=UPI00351131B9